MNVGWMRREYYARCTLDCEERTQYRRLNAGIKLDYVRKEIVSMWEYVKMWSRLHSLTRTTVRDSVFAYREKKHNNNIYTAICNVMIDIALSLVGATEINISLW